MIILEYMKASLSLLGVCAITCDSPFSFDKIYVDVGCCSEANTEECYRLHYKHSL